MPIDRATVQPAERVQIAADLDSQRIADAARSHWLEAGKPYEALDLGRRRSVVRRVKEHRWPRCSMRARTKQGRRQRSKRLGVAGPFRKPAADDLSGGLAVGKRSRDVSVRADRDRLRGIDHQLAGQ